jgi:hypothetical protein
MCSKVNIIINEYNNIMAKNDFNNFPEDFTLNSCMNIITNKQKEMSLKVRKDFYEKIMNSVNECHSKVTLEFPHNYWPVHKKEITIELLEIFGELTIKNINKKAGSSSEVLVSLSGQEIHESNGNITNIIIKFMNDE